MNISQALDYIHNVKWQKSKPGLSRTQELLKALGNPEKQLKFVHVAGTNGKGSTCAFIASILKSAGYVTGLYTSPFIVSFNERLQIDGEPISDEDLIKLTEEIKPHADAMKDSPTEFEMITALGMKYFAMYNCDIVVLEVGMGGELDSTNVIETPELAVITAIDYDHVSDLGPTMCDIARAKAGIIKDGGDVLIYGGNADVEKVIYDIAHQRGATVSKAVFSRITANISLASTKMTIEPYERMLLPPMGAYQPNNVLMAVTAIEILRDKGYRITQENIVEGLSKAKLPGRFEILGYDPVFVLDGAHNPHGIKAAMESLKKVFGNRKYIFILGVLADKDIGSMIDIISPMAQCVFAVEPNSPRSLSVNKLTDEITRHNIPVTQCNSISEGVESALDAAGDCEPLGVICAIGSLYLSADILKAYNSCNVRYGH